MLLMCQRYEAALVNGHLGAATSIHKPLKPISPASLPLEVELHALLDAWFRTWCVGAETEAVAAAGQLKLSLCWQGDLQAQAQAGLQRRSCS